MREMLIICMVSSLGADQAPLPVLLTWPEEVILDEFPWFDVLDSWWDGQPKYSDVLISNSSAPGRELSAAYEKLLDESTDSPDQPASVLPAIMEVAVKWC